MSDLKSQSKPDSDNNSPLGIVVELPLKFNFFNCSDISMDLNAQNKLAFDLADTFTPLDSSITRHVDNHLERGVLHEQSVQNRLLEKKLSLVLQLLNTLLANLAGATLIHLVKLSATTVEWDNALFQSDSSLSIVKDQNLIFDFYPASELPYPIKRCGVVVDVKGSFITAKFLPLDPHNQERFEKWIFQLHRRNLQLKSS